MKDETKAEQILDNQGCFDKRICGENCKQPLGENKVESCPIRQKQLQNIEWGIKAGKEEQWLKSEKAQKESSKIINELREENTRLKNTIIGMGNTIRENKDMWDYFSSRFVKVSTCTADMKVDCGMFQEGLCEGERCMEWVDLVALLDKATEEGKVL